MARPREKEISLLFARILVDFHFDGNLASFAEFLGIKLAGLRRYLIDAPESLPIGYLTRIATLLEVPQEKVGKWVMDSFAEGGVGDYEEYYAKETRGMKKREGAVPTDVERKIRLSERQRVLKEYGLI